MCFVKETFYHSLNDDMFYVINGIVLCTRQEINIINYQLLDFGIVMIGQCQVILP